MTSVGRMSPFIAALLQPQTWTSWREVWQRRKLFHFALAGTWLLLAWLVIATGGRGGATGFSLGAGWLAYWATQFRAVVKYLALTFWPHPLVFDYGVEWARGAMDVVPYAIAVVALAAGTIVALARNRPVAFLGVWSFAVLAPTSVLPGGRQTMAEHRMYLPLAAVIVFVVLWLHRCLGRRGIAPGICVAALLGALTVHRNADYRSTLAIWADTVAKQPDNRWARDNLGNALLEAGRPAEALTHYEAALRLDPNDAVHHCNAGNAFAQLGRMPEALAQFTEAVRLDGNYVAARKNLGNLLYHAGRFEEAVAQYAAVVRLAPQAAENHGNLGNAFVYAGRTDEAVREFTAALQLQPDYAEAAYNLGCVFLERGRLAEAAARFETAVRASPGHAEAQNNLGSALARLGRIDDALRHIRESVRLNPANAEAHHNLGLIYLHLGRDEEALAELTETLRLKPDHAAARQSLERLRRSRPR